MSLSDTTVNIIKASSGPVVINSELIALRMYDILFSKHPELKPMFADADPQQHKKVAAIVSAFAMNIDNPGTLAESLEEITQSHVRTLVKPEHYPMVGEALLQAIRDVFANESSSELIEAWREAYGYLADVLIAREKELYGAL